MEIAIVVDKIKKDQMLFDIKNQCAKHNIIVYSNKETYLNYNLGFTVLTYYDIWNSSASFHIATCIKSAEKLLSNPKIDKFYFYIWDLEWNRKLYDYDFLSKIYLNEKAILVARSKSHADAINLVWNRECFIMEDFSFDMLLEQINEKINI